MTALVRLGFKTKAVGCPTRSNTPEFFAKCMDTRPRMKGGSLSGCERRECSTSGVERNKNNKPTGQKFEPLVSVVHAN